MHDVPMSVYIINRQCERYSSAKDVAVDNVVARAQCAGAGRTEVKKLSTRVSLPMHTEKLNETE